jgi:hypothetical protein
MRLLLLVLFVIYASASAAALVFLWRRVESMSGEIAQLRRALGARMTPQLVRRAEPGGIAPIVDDDETAEILTPTADDEGSAGRAARTWGLPSEALSLPLARVALSPETLRGIVLGVLATAPALAFFFRADAATIVASGLAVAAAMMVIALRAVWRTAAWAAVFTAGAWALLGFALAAAHADPTSYSICLALAGTAGLLHAHLRRATPGATMALTMSAAALALGSQTGMIGPPGLAFSVIVALAAIVGALSLRLEAMHLAAFGASVIGLFVLSGQDSAAIWFTPVTTWAGALFLGIAAIRVPELGARGLALAGTGAFGAIGAILALNGAQHGLAHPYAAAGAFVALAAALGAIITAGALRRERGLAALRFALWMLALGAFFSISAAIVFALSPPLAAPAFALVALGLVALDQRFPEMTWRTFAVAASLLGVIFAAITAQTLLSEANTWPGLVLIGAGLAAPAVILGAAAYFCARHPTTAALFEMFAIVLGVAAANLAVRLLFSDGATLSQAIGFVEASVHAAAWLLGALMIGSRAHRGAVGVRIAAINTLTFAALGLMTLAGVLWMTSYWTEHVSAGPTWLQRDTLGFIIPGVLFWMHWVFWRARGADLQTRLVFGAGALLIASFITLEALRAESLPDWTGALAGAVSFALALGLNFAPGITNADGPHRSELQKELHGDGRSQKRRQAR